jgi:hypothetical protein
MNSVLKKLLLVVGGIAICFATVTAQDAQAPVQGKAAERVEQFKKIRLMEVLGLDEQSSIKFFARYNKNLGVMKELRQKQIETLARIQSMRKGKATDNEYAKVVTELRSLEDQVNQAKSNYIDDLKDVLTSKQLAEYLVFELRFQQNLRDLVRDVQQKRQELQKR